MPRLTYGADSTASPEEVIDVVKDFSERRRELWPIIDSYEVTEVTKDFADVTEGTDALGRTSGLASATSGRSPASFAPTPPTPTCSRRGAAGSFVRPPGREEAGSRSSTTAG